MLTTFEKHSEDLSEKELAIKDIVIEAFRTALPAGMVYKCNVLLQRLNNYLLANCPGYVMNDVRLRKWCNYMRTNSILPIIASAKGYEITWDREKIYNNIQSLRERANSINGCAEGLLNLITS